MKKQIALMTAWILTVFLLATPLATHAVALEATTTKPYTTTTTTWVWDCISTTPPMTTTTTLNLTGPDGMDPNRTTWPPTTLPTTLPPTTNTVPPTTTTGPDDELPTTHPVTIDLLSTADFFENGNISVLADPNYGGEWMSADCYTYDGASIIVIPDNGGPWDIRVLRYLHFTVTANAPFAVTAADATEEIEEASKAWFAEAFGVEPVDGFLPKGKYVGVIDLYEMYSALLDKDADVIALSAFEVALSKPGSFTVGHIALSPDAVCTKSAPEIQTTTFPKFPTTGTTDVPMTTDTTVSTVTTTTTTVPYTYPTTTTSTHIIYTTDTTLPPTTTTTVPPPTSGGTTQLTTTTLPNGATPYPPVNPSLDFNGDGANNMFDCLLVYRAASGADRTAVDPARCDFNGDGAFNMLDCLMFFNSITYVGDLPRA